MTRRDADPQAVDHLCAEQVPFGTPFTLSGSIMLIDWPGATPYGSVTLNITPEENETAIPSLGFQAWVPAFLSTSWGNSVLDAAR